MKIYRDEKEILYELALMMNYHLFEENHISYSLYEMTQKKLLEKMNSDEPFTC